MDKSLVISGLLFVLYGVTDGQLYRHDYFLDEAAGGWLKFHPMPVKWEEAALRCHYEGAILASPINEDMVKVLSTVMVDYGVKNEPIFTGISNIHSKSEYQSMEGVPISNACISWSTEPNLKKLTSQNICITMNANGTATAVSCSDQYAFACYRDAEVKLNECGPVGTGFKLDNRSGSCYKAVNELVSWHDAFKACAREGGHLAIINSETEAEVIWELAKQVLSKHPVPQYKYVQIGFRAWDVQPRTWITVHGQSLSAAGYTKWGPGEPNHEQERCGTVCLNGAVKEGLLNDGECEVKRKFICEIDPKVATISL